MENVRGFDTTLLLNNVYNILVKIAIKLIFLSNLFFNSFMKMKSEKRNVICFPFFIKNKKQIIELKNPNKILLKYENSGHLFEFRFSC